MEMRHGAFGNVVRLFKGSRPARRDVGVNFPALTQVNAYWEALRAGRIMPDRSEVDPRGLGAALEYAFLMEQVAPGIGRIRVAGLHMRDLLGMDVRGMPLTAFFAPGARDRVSRLLERVVTTPEVADLTLLSPASLGAPEITSRLFMAPLSTHDRGAPRVLGCLESSGVIGRPPRRFDIVHVQMRRIVAAARPTEAGDNSGEAAQGSVDNSDTPTESQGFAEPGHNFTYLPSRDSKRGGKPHLRLVKSDD